MNLNYIGTMIAAKTITAAMGRILEIAFYGAIISVLTYIEQCLQLGTFEGRKVPTLLFLSSLICGVLSGYRKQISDLQQEKQNVLDSLNITTPDEETPI